MFGRFKKKNGKENSSRVHVMLAAHSSKGGRQRNEDAYGYWQYEDKGICVLADGLGGHGNGDFASQTAVRSIVESAQRDFSSSMEKLLLTADEAVRGEQKKDPSKDAMRTTVVVLRYDVQKGKIEYAHAGDSRMYLFRKGDLLFRTKDHSMSQLAVDMGQIAEEKLRSHEDRNKVTKVLGGSEELVLKEGCFGEEKLQRGDAFLLCSDGVWEYVYDREMEMELAKAQTPEEWLHGMEQRLLARAREKNDNYTFICGIAGE